jgi:hypothetical protein
LEFRHPLLAAAKGQDVAWQYRRKIGLWMRRRRGDGDNRWMGGGYGRENVQK